tara:strand:- start:377 stop:766 length:390 start_codon:yes stop_codon:yes gene_type:complete
MKYQLFQQMPDENFLLKLLNCYDITDINDNKEFSKCDLIDLQIVNRIENLIPELVLYYLPCKYDMFLNNITINKCITILRQVLRLFDYHLKKREHVHNKKKSIYYRIEKKDDKNIKIENDTNKCILSFS